MNKRRHGLIAVKFFCGALLLALVGAVSAGEEVRISTFAGGVSVAGNADGISTVARFNIPRGIAVDNAGNIYVADCDNHTIRKITPAGVVTTLAGLAGNIGGADGTGSAARFDFPFGVAVDGAGNVYVADTGNSTIRKITPGGLVTTLAGLAGNTGSANGQGDVARFFSPYSVTVDNTGNVYVADTDNHTIRKITPGGLVTTLAGLAGNTGSANGQGDVARFFHPGGVMVDVTGNVYVADTDNYTIRKITPGGLVTTLAGLAGNIGNADGIGSAARFNFPRGVTVDSAGNVYVADCDNHTIRKITPSGVVTTLAGLAGNPNTTDGVGSEARFNFPNGIAIDSNGVGYITDTVSYTIRKCMWLPVLTSALTLTGTAGVPLRSYTIMATGSMPITFAAAPLPSGLTLSGATISGTPAQAGSYAVTLSATNAGGLPIGGTTTATLVITVNPLTTTSDDDADGFPDELEMALGTNPIDTASTPFNGALAGTAQIFNISKMQIKLDFKKSNNDRISIQGTMPAANDFNFLNQTVVLDIGGVVKSFVLDVKGKSPAGDSTIKFNKPKGGAVKFIVKLIKGSFTAKLADENLVGTTSLKSAPREVVIIGLFNQTLFNTTRSLLYTVKAGKSGLAK